MLNIKERIYRTFKNTKKTHKKKMKNFLDEVSEEFSVAMTEDYITFVSLAGKKFIRPEDSLQVTAQFVFSS